MEKSEYINTYLEETAEIVKIISRESIEKVLDVLLEVKREGGRIFFLGVGGGAGTGSHAANDFNKISGIPSICVADNASLLTALANDEGWESVFKRALEMHKLGPEDCLFIFSVGGGTETSSKNLVLAINYAKEIGAKIVGVVGKETGATATKATACIIVPCLDDSKRTPHTEDFQMIMDHLLSNLLAKLSENNSY